MTSGACSENMALTCQDQVGSESGESGSSVVGTIALVCGRLQVCGRRWVPRRFLEVMGFSVSARVSLGRCWS